MNDIKIAIIGRKHDEYMDDELLNSILTLLEQATPDRRRAFLYKMLQTAHANGRRQTAAWLAEKASNIVQNMELLSEFDKSFGFLADAPIRPEPDEDEDES